MRLLAAVMGIMVLAAGGLKAGDEPQSYDDLLAAGQSALRGNNLGKAAHAFQRAVDLNPSSAEGHAGLGTALSKMLEADSVSAARESDAAERAENHLNEAAQLAPSDPRPLFELAQLDTFLATVSTDPEQRALRFRNARQAIQREINLEPGKAELYQQLANIEREEFGPVLDDTKARFAKSAGPIPDENLRKRLQQQYGDLINDAIHNAKAAANVSDSPQRAFFLLSKLYGQRSLLRDSQEQYAMDMQTATDYERQFLAAGGHLGDAMTITQH